MTSDRRTTHLMLLAALLLAGQLCAQEVTFEGRTLTQWIGDLQGDDWQTRLMAAWAIGQMGADAAPAVPSLTKALKDQDSAVRMYAAHALGAIGPAARMTALALQAALNDEDEAVQAQAAMALTEIGGGAAPAATPAAGTPPAQAGETPPAAHTGEALASGAPATGTPTVQPPSTVTPASVAPLLEARSADQPWSEEDARLAVEAVASQGLSLGLVDAEGNQLNPNLPQAAVSLSPEGVDAHASLIANGRSRTIGAVVDYLAAAGVNLAATNAPMTVADLLPDLQQYVSWSFANRSDPRSALGLLLASGPTLALPDTQPQIFGDTAVSPLGSLMMLGDLLIGVGDRPGWRQGARPGVSPDGRMLAFAGDLSTILDGAAPGADGEGLRKRVGGMITDCWVALGEAGRMPPTWLRWMAAVVLVHETHNQMQIGLMDGTGAAKQVVLDKPGATRQMRAQIFATPSGTATYGEPVHELTISLGPTIGLIASAAPLFDDADAAVAVGFSARRAEPHCLVANAETIEFDLTATRMANRERREAVLVASARLRQLEVRKAFRRSTRMLKLYEGESFTEDEFAQLADTYLAEAAQALKPPDAMCTIIFRPQGEAESGVVIESLGTDLPVENPRFRTPLIKFDRPMYLIHVIETATTAAPRREDRWILHPDPPKDNTVVTGDMDGFHIHKTDRCLGAYLSNHQVGPVLAQIGASTDVTYGRHVISRHAAFWQEE